MLAIKRAGILLNRDVLFVATGDEEEGGKNGAEWFIDHESTVFSDAGYLINEGGFIRTLSDNKRKAYVVSITEKTPLWLRLTASGPAGHASDSAGRNRGHAPGARVGAIEPVPDPRFMSSGRCRTTTTRWPSSITAPSSSSISITALKDPAYLTQFLDDPSQNAHVRDTITPTVLSASNKTNVISSTAYAEIDCRLAAGQRSQGGRERYQESDRRRLDQNRRHPELSRRFLRRRARP